MDDDSALFYSLLLAKNDTHSIERSLFFICIFIFLYFWLYCLEVSRCHRHKDTVANTVTMHAIKLSLKNHGKPFNALQ